MQVEIITPEQLLFSGEALAAQFPGLDGSFQVLSGHAPIISALKAGVVKVDLAETFKNPEKAHKSLSFENNSKTLKLSIHGGVVEMQNNKIILLAE
jgi:F-type H+-transporting ATPase subunit epsilon